MSAPLAERIRPETLEEVFGQEDLLGKGKPLERIIRNAQIPNMIFYGPPGVGKTTVARIIAENANMRMRRLNGTSASTADIRNVIKESDSLFGYKGVLLYLDEIQYLNKKQQQSLLEYIEDGSVTLISSTTENPYFYVYGAILSRSAVFEFTPVKPKDILPALKRAETFLREENGVVIEAEDGAYERIASGCGGDVRKAVNTLELCALSSESFSVKDETHIKITAELASQLVQRSNMRFDRDGDEHYDLLSALQKSIRGSDPDAALYYAARLIESKDIISLSRRLLVIAAEDVGLAYPNALAIVKACVDSAMQLGLPEARIPLADAAVLLATAPKSNSAYQGVNKALEDVKKYGSAQFPRHLQNMHCDAENAAVRGQHYLYPHDYPYHWVDQQYLPDELKDKVYYTPGENKNEQAAKDYWLKIKNKK